MIRLTAVLLVLLLAAPGTAFAQNSLREGAWGLEFVVQPSIYGFTGGAGVAAKRFFTDRSAVRLGLMVGLSTSDTDETHRTDRAFPYDTVQVASSVSSYSDQRDVTLFLHLARYLEVGSRFGMVVEAGPTVRWGSVEFGRTEVFPPPRSTYINAEDRDSWSYGADLQAGFEWFFRSRLSLSGRYGVTALRTESRQTYRFDFYNPNDGAWDRRYDEARANGWSAQTTPAVLSLTAYW